MPFQGYRGRKGYYKQPYRFRNALKPYVHRPLAINNRSQFTAQVGGWSKNVYAQRVSHFSLTSGIKRWTPSVSESGDVLKISPTFRGTAAQLTFSAEDLIGRDTRETFQAVKMKKVTVYAMLLSANSTSTNNDDLQGLQFGMGAYKQPFPAGSVSINTFDTVSGVQGFETKYVPLEPGEKPTSGAQPYSVVGGSYVLSKAFVPKIGITSTSDANTVIQAVEENTWMQTQTINAVKVYGVVIAIGSPDIPAGTNGEIGASVAYWTKCDYMCKGYSQTGFVTN